MKTTEDTEDNRYLFAQRGAEKIFAKLCEKTLRNSAVYFSAIAIIFVMLLFGCHSPGKKNVLKDSACVNTQNKISLQKSSATSDSINHYSVKNIERFTDWNWDQLDILNGFDHVGKDTLNALNGMLKAEVLHSNYDEDSATRFIFISDSTLKGNRYALNSPIVKFDSMHNHFISIYGQRDKVNGQSIYGTDGEIPVTQFSSITIWRNKKQVYFPKSSYSDLFNPGYAMTIYESLDHPEKWYLEMWGSDSAGGYDVVWVFNGNKYVRRFVANGF